jgi:hypothetical protein
VLIWIRQERIERQIVWQVPVYNTIRHILKNPIYGGSYAFGRSKDKAARQDVEQEAAQELLRTEGHHSLLITVGIILPPESNLVMLESHEAMVGDGHAMGVAGEIAQHMMGTAEGGLGIDDSVLTEQGVQEGAEGLLVGQWLKSSGEGELALLESAL